MRDLLPWFKLHNDTQKNSYISESFHLHLKSRFLFLHVFTLYSYLKTANVTNSTYYFQNIFYYDFRVSNFIIIYRKNSDIYKAIKILYISNRNYVFSHVFSLYSYFKAASVTNRTHCFQNIVYYEFRVSNFSIIYSKNNVLYKSFQILYISNRNYVF